MPFGRKIFLSGSLLAAATALASCQGAQRAATASGGYFPVLSPTDYNYDGMMAILRIANPHKQVFVSENAPGQSEARPRLLRGDKPQNVSELYVRMQLAMNGYDFSLGHNNGSLLTLGILMGSAVILGLNDTTWQKYDIGRHFNLASTNVCYQAKSNLNPDVSPNDRTGMYQDWSGQAVLKRGGRFMVCHNALTNLANSIAGKTSPSDALDEMSHNLLPGFMLVPAGVTAAQLAQENGWKLFIA